MIKMKQHNAHIVNFLTVDNDRVVACIGLRDRVLYLLDCDWNDWLTSLLRAWPVVVMKNTR